MAETLLPDVRLHPEQGRYHNGARYPSLHQGLPSVDELDHRPVEKVVGQIRVELLPLRVKSRYKQQYMLLFKNRKNESRQKVTTLLHNSPMNLPNNTQMANSESARSNYTDLAPITL